MTLKEKDGQYQPPLVSFQYQTRISSKESMSLFLHEAEVLEAMKLQEVSVSYGKMDEWMEHLFLNSAPQKLPAGTDY